MSKYVLGFVVVVFVVILAYIARSSNASHNEVSADAYKGTAAQQEKANDYRGQMKKYSLAK